ncbi:MAG: hypothetical protein ACRDIC_02050, partial [bacterium]
MDRNTRGMALLAVLLALLIITSSSASLIWFMNQQQTRAGARFRSTAALAMAEAGVHRALSILESVAPDGTPGRAWRATAHVEAFGVGALQGRFSLSLTDEAGGAILVTSVGEVAGVTRRLRARVYLASPALLAALHGAGFVRLEIQPAAVVIVPYWMTAATRPWVHIAAGRGIWFVGSDVWINNPSVAFDVGSGPADAPGSARSATRRPDLAPAQLLLPRGVDLTLGQGDPVDIQQLRVMGVRLEETVLRTAVPPRAPEVDRAFFQKEASGNTSNADLNQAAGKYVGDADLVRKRDSLYSERQFARLQRYLRNRVSTPRLVGVIYVRGRVTLVERQRLYISEGALLTEGTLQLRQGATLEVTHSAATRTLPGIVVMDNGALFLMPDARLRNHGVAYVNGGIILRERTRVDTVGAMLSNDPGISFRSLGTVVIRYDPAVLGTPGLRVAHDSPAIAWVAAWQESPSTTPLVSPSPPRASLGEPSGLATPPPPPPLVMPQAQSSPQPEATPLPAVLASPVTPRAPSSPQPVATAPSAAPPPSRPPIIAPNPDVQPED